MLEIPPDITYYLQIVAFLVFAAMLHALVWSPTQQVLDERAKRTSGAQAEAATMREEAAALQAQLDAELEAARQAGSDAGAKIRREAEAAERQILEEARHDAAHSLEDVRQRVTRETALARAALRDQVGSIATLAAEHLLGRSVAA